jgi:hypothetical protein
MIRVLEEKPEFDTAEEFVKNLNKARLANRRAWIVYVGKVQGVNVELKTYDTGYLQILRVNELNAAGPMDMKPTAWKEHIKEAIEREAARMAG